MPKSLPMIAGVALAGAAALWFFSARQRGVIFGVAGSAPAPASLYEPTVSLASQPSQPFTFPPLPNMITNIDVGGCCAACVPSRRLSTAQPGELPIIQETAIAPAMPSIPNSITPVSSGIVGTGASEITLPISFTQFTGMPSAANATKQTAPYLTVIEIAPRGNTAPGFTGDRKQRQRAFA